MISILAAMDEFGDESSVMILAAAIGAAFAGYLFAGFFGHRRRDTDWVLFATGSVLATALGSFLGGMCWGLIAGLLDGSSNQSLLGVMVQAGALGFMVVMVMVPSDFPGVFGLWVLLMALIQVVSLWVRRSQRTAA